MNLYKVDLVCAYESCWLISAATFSSLANVSPNGFQIGPSAVSLVVVRMLERENPWRWSSIFWLNGLNNTVNLASKVHVGRYTKSMEEFDPTYTNFEFHSWFTVGFRKSRDVATIWFNSICDIAQATTFIQQSVDWVQFMCCRLKPSCRFSLGEW